MECGNTADIEVQKNFVEKELAALIKEAKEGAKKIFFVDASHFVMGSGFGTYGQRQKCILNLQVDSKGTMC